MRKRSPVPARLSAALGVWLGFATLAFAQSGLRGAFPEIGPPAPPPIEAIASPAPTAASEGSGTRALEAVGDNDVDLESIDLSGDQILDLTGPALVESSGTFLRRGWWYAKTDLVFLQRTWFSRDLLFAADNDLDGETGLDGPTFPPGAADDGDTARTLFLQNSSPNREEGIRLTLGRFLFRDTSNRDHTAELTYFGGGDFFQDGTLISDNQQVDLTAGGGPQTGRINVPFAIDLGADASFDGAASSAIAYSSKFNSLEWNYVLTSRLNRDRMELLPSGDWVRRANTGWTYHGLFGLRYFDLRERVNWTATDIINNEFAAVADGDYRVLTQNDAFGPQFGGGMTYESDRFNITFGGKIGVLANNVRSREELTFTQLSADGSDPSFVTADREGTLSFLGGFNATARWHLRPHLSLRAGYEAMLLTAVALAPNQINFNPDDDVVVVTGDSFYHGISMGIEGYW